MRDIRSLAGRVLSRTTDPDIAALAAYVLGDEDPTRTASSTRPERYFLMTKWTEFAKEQPPAGYGAVYVTDGTHISYVRRAQLPATEVEKWVLAEPEAQALNLTPQVSHPTHWAVELDGMPNVKARNIVEPSDGGPPRDPNDVPTEPAKKAK